MPARTRLNLPQERARSLRLDALASRPWATWLLLDDKVYQKPIYHQACNNGDQFEKPVDGGNKLLRKRADKLRP